MVGMRRIAIGALGALAVFTATMPAVARPIEVDLSGTATACITRVRWVITAERPGAEPGLIQAAEVALYNGGTLLPVWSASSEIVVTNPGGAGSDPVYGEGPEKAYDGSPDTKWLDFNFDVNSGSTLLIQFPEPVTFDSYAWTTGNDMPGRDPISWRLEVSSDGVSWTTVDTRSDVAVTEDRAAVVGPFGVTYAGCQTTGKDFGSGRSGGAKSGPGENRDDVLALDPRLRGRGK